jgi:hypothetical protein
MQSFAEHLATTGSHPALEGEAVQVVRQRRQPLRKFHEGRGGRRLGDRIAYVTRPELLDGESASGVTWVEDPTFSEAQALKSEPGLSAILDLARRNGIALCIKG